MTVKSIVAKYHDSFSEFMDKATDKEKIIVFRKAAREAIKEQREMVREYATLNRKVKKDQKNITLLWQRMIKESS